MKKQYFLVSVSKDGLTYNVPVEFKHCPEVGKTLCSEHGKWLYTEEELELYMSF